MDFHKVFDIINHSILYNKFATSDISNHVVLSKRNGQQTVC